MSASGVFDFPWRFTLFFQGLYGIFQGFYGMFHGFYGIFHGFYGIVQGFYGIFHGFYGISMGLVGVKRNFHGTMDWDFDGIESCLSYSDGQVGDHENYLVSGL